MAWSFGDSFDLYAGFGDAIAGYWDSGSAGSSSLALTGGGRFGAGQFLRYSVNPGGVLAKASNVNDSVHHLVLAYRTSATLTGTTLGAYFTLYDGATAQCTVVFRSDGAILITSGGPTGTARATFVSAITALNTWYSIEIEIVVHSTAGSFAVRKNGNTVNDFSASGLITAVSANNYANKLQTGVNANVNAQDVDDFFWQSGAAAGNWLGDIRCYTRMPASDQSTTFSKSPTNFFAQTTAATGNVTSLGANSIRATSVVAPTTGTLASLTFNFTSALTGHAKMALYDASGSGGGAGALLASSAELTNPGAGVNTFAVTGGPTVQRGVTYWVALWSDAAITPNGAGGITTDSLALTYTTSFPSTLVGFTSAGVNGIGSNGMNVTPFNAGCVNEQQEDGLTSYVYDSNPGDADFYAIGSIASTPASVIAVTTRGYMQKSDAGARTAAVQLKSGATTAATPTLTLSSSGWLWAWRTDLTDPNTGAAWTPAAVNNAQIGPVTVA